MRYIISDIHGCYEEYREMLERIRFSDEDELYVLGDSMDRGPEPIRVIQDMMERPNVTYIFGNHDYVMVRILRKLAVEVTEDNWKDSLSVNDVLEYMYWVEDGGGVTSRQFRALSRGEQQDILDYLEDALAYAVLEHEGKKYILVHGGLDGFREDKDLDEYRLSEFIFCRMDYTKRYFQDENTYVVTGHTPTLFIRPDGKSEIYQGNGHIAIDCGCVFGERLAAYCVETGECFYVESKGRC